MIRDTYIAEYVCQKTGCQAQGTVVGRHEVGAGGSNADIAFRRAARIASDERPFCTHGHNHRTVVHSLTFEERRS